MLKRLAKNLVDHLSSNDYQTLNRIELNKSRVISNVELVKSKHPGFGVIPVLKANAYGHGLVEMSKILNEAAVTFIAVDGYFEAAKVRYLSSHKILVMGYIKPENVSLIDAKRCSFVVQDIAGLNALAKLKRQVNVHLELNSGMNRLGLAAHEIKDYLATLKSHHNLVLEGVMTHLADADNPADDDFTAAQVKFFDETLEQILSEGFKPKYIHVAQTAGSTKAKSKYANNIRLGIGLYGINPLSPKDKSYAELQALKPVLELKSTIIKTIDLKKGDRVSYNGVFSAPGLMRIGVLPLGYYEGLPRELSNKGVLSAEEQELQIVGRVCMNHTMIDITGTDLDVNSEVTVISSDLTKINSIYNLCRRYNLFSYLILTGLSSSIRRKII